MLGYRTAAAATAGALYDEGRRVRGHEFHRTTTAYVGKPAPAWHLPGGPEGVVTPTVHASYLHLHWTGTPDVAGRFAAAARKAMPGT
jgi:cobyrinic acid a,c-diamide synthase